DPGPGPSPDRGETRPGDPVGAPLPPWERRRPRGLGSPGPRHGGHRHDSQRRRRRVRRVGRAGGPPARARARRRPGSGRSVMTAWLAAGAGLMGLMLPCALVAARGSPVERLLGLELGSVLASLTFLVLAEGFGRSIYADLGLAFALASFVGTLVFVRLLERWV